MTSTLVIPTMRRKETNFDYFKNIIENGHYEFFDKIYIYLSEPDEKDIEEVKSIISNKKNFQIIIRHKDYNKKYYDKILENFKKDSYSYWRSHLCLDFVSSTSFVSKLTNSDYIIWLEDDTIIGRNFQQEFNKLPQGTQFINFWSGGGTCCRGFLKSELPKFNNFILNNYLDDIPLDWMIVRGKFRFKKTKQVVYHIGVISSRNDTTVERINESNLID